MAENAPKTIGGLLGVEGRAAFAYFLAWQRVPLNWKGLDRRPIPKDWYQVGPRTSANGKVGVNRRASHPVNALLNYAYAILESHVRIRIIAGEYDPTIGYLHTHQKDRAALVFDLMEPLRPVVDRIALEFVQLHTFQRADFMIRDDGVCRLNPQMTKQLVAGLEAQLARADSGHISVLGARELNFALGDRSTDLLTTRQC